MFEHRFQVRGHQVQPTDPVLAEGLAEAWGVLHRVVVEKHQPAAVEQAREQLLHRDRKSQGGLLRDHLARLERPPGFDASEPVHELAMRNSDSFGDPGGARRVHDVGKCAESRLLRRSQCAGGIQQSRVPIDGKTLGVPESQTLLAKRVRYDRNRLGVVQNLRQIAFGISGIERDVSGARFPDREQTDQGLCPAFQAHPHDVPRPYPLGQQTMRQLAAARFDCCVAPHGLRVLAAPSVGSLPRQLREAARE